MSTRYAEVVHGAYQGKRTCRGPQRHGRLWIGIPPPTVKRPAWLNWLYLLIFLWSSWQLAGMWWQQLHG
ncbi:MAG: hypothetical protein F4025_06745 [Synechococcus sp. SB0669_bin_7]|nr:hypothetical protein [Synechococcus sp. SB0675_bin_7]MYK86088.1 hypothetical protein [Synechococcus sp. SB0669_bin_7]